MVSAERPSSVECDIEQRFQSFLFFQELSKFKVFANISFSLILFTFLDSF